MEIEILLASPLIDSYKKIGKTKIIEIKTVEEKMIFPTNLQLK